MCSTAGLHLPFYAIFNDGSRPYLLPFRPRGITKDMAVMDDDIPTAGPENQMEDKLGRFWNTKGKTKILCYSIESIGLVGWADPSLPWLSCLFSAHSTPAGMRNG